jgi:hypothetical protein
LLNLVERLLILSPQELGQPAPREISATEVAEISSTTNSIYSFISEGIDDMRSAAKKLFYEHLVSCSTDKFTVPISQRYTDQVITDAGFQSQDEGISEASARNVIGEPTNLIHEYLFTSRDGAERARDTQSAQVLSQTLQGLMQVEGVPQALGKERIFGFLNEIFRLSGAHDLRLDTDEADQQAEIGEMQNEQFVAQLKEQWPQVMQAVQQLMQVAQQQAPEQPVAPEGAPPMEPGQQPQVNPDQQVEI